jgi:hypothetical protein
MIPFEPKSAQIIYFTCPNIGKTDLPDLKSHIIPYAPVSPVN